MSEEQTQQEPSASPTFYDQVDWDLIKFNKISKEDFLRLKAKNKKSYATLLGSQDELQFYMFRPLLWSEYKDIRQKNLDKYKTQEYILSACMLWPKVDILTINSIEAGTMLTLVYQMLAVSYFLSDPTKAIEMIIEV
jgi:hypothetical protein